MVGVETKKDERKKKKEGVLKGCLLFSFLLFCLFSQSFLQLVILVQIWLFLLFWKFHYFRILEIFNCDFVWTLRGIRVRGDASSSSGLKKVLARGQVLNKEKYLLSSYWYLKNSNNMHIQQQPSFYSFLSSIVYYIKNNILQ